MFYADNIHVMSVKANNPELSLTPGQSPPLVGNSEGNHA